MQKICALLLAITLTLGTTAVALAEGDKTGTTTLTATVPEHSYTINIPADMTLEFGNDDYQVIGDVYVSNLVNIAENADRMIGCGVTATDLKKGEKSIPVAYYYKEGSSWTTLRVDGSINTLNFDPSSLKKYTISAKIKKSDWGTAEPGAYTATITFDFKFWYIIP